MEEASRRITLTMAWLTAMLVACANAAEQITHFALKPLARLLMEAGAHNTGDSMPPIAMDVVLMTSLYLTAPVALYQVWAFYNTRLGAAERPRAFAVLVIAVAMPFVSGVFAYYVVMPCVLHYLLGIGNDAVIA